MQSHRTNRTHEPTNPRTYEQKKGEQLSPPTPFSFVTLSRSVFVSLVVRLRAPRFGETRRSLADVLARRRRLEHELQPELKNARITLVRVGAGDASKRRAVYGSGRIGEIHVVEDVEEL